MLLFLKIVAGCVVAIVLIAAVLMFFLRRYIKRCVEQSQSEQLVPLLIHLNEDLEPNWEEDKEVNALIKEFQDNGFTPGKTYTVQEMDGVSLISLFHEKFAGVIYRHDLAGCFFDIVHEGVDKKAFTVTTAPSGEELESIPGKEKEYFEAGASFSDLFIRIQNRCRDLDSNTLNDHVFREYFELYYKDEQAHRVRNGGVGYSEFRKISENSESNLSEQELREAFVSMKTDELEQWTDYARDEYVEAMQFSHEDERRYGNYFIVPKKTDAESFVRYLSYYDLIHEDHVEKIGRSVRDDVEIESLFEKLNEARSPELRAIKRGAVNFRWTL